MKDDENLSSMVDNIVADNTEQAQVDFHEYLTNKVRQELNTQPAEPAED